MSHDFDSKERQHQILSTTHPLLVEVTSRLQSGVKHRSFTVGDGREHGPKRRTHCLLLESITRTVPSSQAQANRPWETR